MSEMWDERLLPPDRERDGDPSDRRLLLVILLIFGGGGLLVLICGGLLAWQIFEPVSMPDVIVETAQQRREDLRTGFGAADVGVSPQEFEELEQFFEELAAASMSESDNDFRRLVDRNRMFEAMKASGKMDAPWSLFGEMTKDMALSNLGAPWYTERVHIVHVRSGPGADERVAYVYLFDSVGDAVESRWWLTHSGSRWKAYDWEVMQFGLRESYSYALYEQEESLEYNRIFEELGDAYTDIDSYDYESARSRIERAESLLDSVPGDLGVDVTLWTAHSWSYLGSLPDAVRVAERLDSPSDWSGVVLLRMQLAEERSEHERVLQLCDEYESLIGPSPNSVRMRVAAFSALDQWEEAAAECRRYFDWNAADAEMLRVFALSLSRDEKEELASILETGDDPAAAALELANVLSGYGDVDALDVLASVVEAHAASAAEGLYVQALRADAAGDVVRAAELYLEAMRAEPDPDAGWSYLWGHADAITRLGRIVEGYRDSPYADETFQYLVSGYDGEEESLLKPELLRALAAEHQQRSPNDPWLWYHLGNLAWSGGDYAAAVGHYRQGLKFANKDDDEDYSWWPLDDQLQSCLIEDDRWQEAYEAGQDPAETFVAVADGLRWRERLDELQALIDLHGTRHPDEPKLPYYSAIIAVEEGRFEEAERLLDDAKARLPSDDDDEYARTMVDTLRVTARIEAGNPLAAYDDPRLRETAFSQIAGHFVSRDNWQAVEDLAARYRNDSPHLVDGWYWGAHARWQREDYAGVAELLTGVNLNWLEETEYSYYRSQAENFLFRSLLRLQRFDDAAQYAAELSERDDDDNLLRIAKLATATPDEAVELLQGYESARWDSLFTDPDVGPILISDEFASVRAETSMWPPYVTESIVVALLARPADLSLDAVESRCRAALGEDVIIETSEDAQPERWIVRNGNTTCFIVTGDGPYVDYREYSTWNLASEDVRSALKQHTSWLAVCTASVSTAADDGDQVARFRRGVARCLIDDSTLAVYDSDEYSVVPAGEALDVLLPGEATSSDWETAGESLGLWQDIGQLGYDRETTIRDHLQRRLPEISLLLWRSGEAEAEMTIELGDGHAAERLQVILERVSPGNYSDWNYTGRLTADSRIASFLKEGDLIQFNEYDVVDWSLSVDGAARNGRSEAEAWWDRTRAAADEQNQPP